MQQKKECLIDTNVILRFLLNDVAEQAEKAKRLFEAVEIGIEKVYLTDLVLSECIWVLEKFYKVPRKEIKNSVKPIIMFQGVNTQSSKSLLLEALDLWEEKEVDWTDALLTIWCLREERTIISFDKDFDKLSVVRREV